MSIVHEALKKARQKIETTALIQETKELSFTEIAHPWRQRVAPLGIIIIAGVALYVFLFALLQNRGIDPKGNPSPPPSNVLMAPSQIDGSTSATSLKPREPHLSSGGARDAFEKGIALYRDGDLTRAEEQFTAALARDPMLAEAHNGLGLVYKVRGDWDQARRHYQLALDVRPDYVEVLNNLAVLYDQSSETKEAQRLYEKALTLDPRYAQAHLNYAISLEKSGLIEEARREYQIFISSASIEQQDLVRTVQNRLKDLQ